MNVNVPVSGDQHVLGSRVVLGGAMELTRETAPSCKQRLWTLPDLRIDGKLTDV
jgi:hypothetical protein